MSAASANRTNSRRKRAGSRKNKKHKDVGSFKSDYVKRYWRISNFSILRW